MAKFQQRHYVAIAEIVRTLQDGSQASIFDTATANTFAHKCADLFGGDNPRFDRDRFLSACGISPRDNPKRQSK